jgi:hypothetical protein
MRSRCSRRRSGCTEVAAVIAERSATVMAEMSATVTAEVFAIVMAGPRAGHLAQQGAENNIRFGGRP